MTHEEMLFARYIQKINNYKHDDVLTDHSRLSLINLIWLCEKAIEEDLPVDKMNRWLGFVQGCLAMRGIIDVDEERDYSRQLFNPTGTLETYERT